MVTASRILAYQNPAAQPLLDHLVTNAGDGDAIALWNPALGAQPTIAELEAIEASAGYQTYSSAPAVAARAEQASGATVGRTTVKRLANDASTASAAFVDVPDLQFQLLPNKHYKFRFVGAYIAAAGTTGLQLSVNGPASPVLCRFVGKIFTGATAVAGGVGASYDTPLAATSSGGATPLPFEVDGTISTGAAGGVFTLRGRSEVAGSAVTLLAGTYGELAVVG